MKTAVPAASVTAWPGRLPVNATVTPPPRLEVKVNVKVPGLVPATESEQPLPTAVCAAVPAIVVVVVGGAIVIVAAGAVVAVAAGVVVIVAAGIVVVVAAGAVVVVVELEVFELPCAVVVVGELEWSPATVPELAFPLPLPLASTAPEAARARTTTTDTATTHGRFHHL